MSAPSPQRAAGSAPAEADAVRRLRHELRTPVNHLLGYAELLLEDATDGDGAWGAQLRRIQDAGSGLLEPIDAMTEALRDGATTLEIAYRIRTLLAEIDDACDRLDVEAARLGDDAAAADIAAIRTAGARLLTLVTTPAAVAANDPDDDVRQADVEGMRPDSVGEPGTILVVDDDPNNREILSRRLARLGHAVEVAPGGQEALAMLGARSFDLLLLDVMMPEMDGFEVLARLKAAPALRELPVIMLSALDEVAAAVRCIELGADDYLTKPADAVLLRARIGACLERKRLRDTEVAYLRQAAHVTGPAIIAHALTADPGEDAADDESSLRAAIVREVDWIDLPKSGRLFAAGDPGNDMYVVLSGRLRVDEPDERGELRPRGEARRGETLGELEMLTGQPRSTTATAVRDARLARIPREGFERLATGYPRLLTRTTRDVIDRLRDAFQRRPTDDPVTAFTLLPVSDGVAIAETARHLADALARHGTTLLLDRENLPAMLGDEAGEYLASDVGAARLTAWLNELELRFRYVIYQADPEPSAWTRRCLRQADHVLLVGCGRPEPDYHGLADEVAGSAHGAPVDLLVLHDSATERPVGTGDWLGAWNVRLHHHLRVGDAASLDRVVRRLTGSSTDVVFGGGGARGWAHVGVIRALEEADIPIDAIGGTSMGAVIGGAAALGVSWRELQERASHWSSPRRLFDYTLPIVSVLAGSKMTALLRDVYGDARIEDFWRGFFCVSSSLTRGHPVIHRQGQLWKAVRSSISIPGLLPPIKEGQELLIDGGYLNNLPTRIMRELFESGSLVAVSVDEAVDMPGEVDFGPAVSGWEVFRRRLVPWAANLPAPSLGVTVMRAASLSSIHNLDASVRLADLVIVPPVERFGTLDFAAYQQIIDAGYEGASRQIEQWQRSHERHAHV